MSIRYKLFLWVGGVFFISLLFSIVLQVYLTHHNLTKASQDFEKTIILKSEEMGERWEKSVRLFLSGSIAELMTLTKSISTFQSFKDSFGPSDENIQYKTWTAATNLLIEDKWVEFLQNTVGDEVLSILIPSEMNVETSFKKDIDQDLSWISLQGSSTLYLGIRCKKDEQSQSPHPLFEGENPNIYFLFTPEELKALDPTWEKKSIDSGAHLDPLFLLFYGSEDVNDFRISFSKKIEKANEYLKQNKIPINKSFSQEDKQTKDTSTPSSFLEERVSALTERNQKLAMILALSSYLQSGLSGSFTPNGYFPKGVAYFPSHQGKGNTLPSDQVFLQTPLSLNGAMGKISVLSAPKYNTAYLTETLLLNSSTDKAGSLTLGFGLDKIVTELALSTDQNVFVVANGNLIQGYDENGKEIEKDTLSSLPLEKIQNEKNGFFNLNNASYFFLQLIPIPELDLHFYLVTPKEKQLAMVSELQKGTEELIDTLSWYMRAVAILALIVALVLLNQLAKKMARPIQSLAKAANAVSQGFLDKVEIPYTKDNSKNEIHTLCVSFERMIEGLKEKEKVRAVLNKVVSPEIATEILQNPLQLGGEEKKLTVLFADIRGFTHLTEHMPPQEVIGLLNECMTKISTLVDAHKGIIDKYVGDEAMALFGFPKEEPQSVTDAVACALNIVESMVLWNQERERQNLPKIEVGIGVHTGMVVAGNMGSENRLNYTVLGRNVNLTARLCSLAKSDEVLITEDVLKSPGIVDLFFVEKMPDADLKGFSHSFPIYKVLGKKLPKN